MEQYDNELLEIADNLAEIAERIKAFVRKKRAHDIVKTVKSDDSKMEANQNNMSVADFRKLIVPYFKLDRKRLQRVLVKFGVKSITEVNAEAYDSFIKTLEDEYKGDVE